MQALVDTFFSALRTLGSNRLRSGLTLLGIVIGVVAVVAMAATTVGLRENMNRSLEQLGTGVFQVQKWPHGFGPRNMAKIEKRKNFRLADVYLLEQHCRTCLHVGGEAWQFGQKVVGNGKTHQGAQTVGGTVEFFHNNGYAAASGRLFTEGEIAAGADVAVLGSDVMDVLFPKQDAVGATIRVQNHVFRVIGTLERRGQSMEGSIDNLVAIPITNWQLLFGTKESLNVTIMARDPDKISACEDEVVALLRKARGVPPEAENDFDLFSNRSVQEQFDQIMSGIAAGSLGITGLSLLIGGIGVMNIMLVAVTERTNEIGVRRALGARRRRILGQFVTEAVMLTLVGGAIGVALGVAVAWLIKVMIGLPTIVPAWAVVLSMITAGGTGLVFGIYPAYRASRLDPVEAMRHE
jgi:putative ABC transport system permease protein